MGKLSHRPLITALLGSAVIVGAALLALWLLEEHPGKGRMFADKAGLVLVRGPIESSDRVVEALDDFAEDPEIKAIVLRVESPGGGVAPSQEIYAAVNRAKERKPVVASLGSVAASGGYYIAAPASRIVANPGTLTGSIGVIMAIPDLQKLFELIGIRLQVVKAGELKATGTPDRPLSEAERAMLQAAIDEVHEQFIADVAQGRNLPAEKVRSLANGAIFTGGRARELGLVDDLGGLGEAVELAGHLAGLEGRPELVEPAHQRRGWLARFLEDELHSFLRALRSELGLPGFRSEYRPRLGE